jgi:hypothetical protein
VNRILNSRPNLNALDNYGTTPLIEAISRGYTDLALNLLSAGAAKDAGGLPILAEALHFGDFKLTLSTPHHALRNLAKGSLTRPNNFMMLPQISRFGHPEGVDPNKFTLITQFSSERDQWMYSKCVDIHDSQSPFYELTDEYDGRRVVVKNFFMLLDSYKNHPEAKCLGPDGKPCEFDTRGLLQRVHIVANWPPIYIGKQSDKHWEEGEDLSLLDFKAVDHKRKETQLQPMNSLRESQKFPTGNSCAGESTSTRWRRSARGNPCGQSNLRSA